MGACASTDSGGVDVNGSPEEIKQSKAIDKILRDEERRLAREVKILLLGPGSSGKSTLLKQIKIIHLDGFSRSEIESYRQTVFRNVMESMKACIDIVRNDFLSLDPANEPAAQTISEASADLVESRKYPSGLLEPLRALWLDPAIQSVVARGNEADVPECMPYFFFHLDRLWDPTYVPILDDILRSRQKTVGITETQFKSADLQYRIFDVGGQRSERKKWIHCFEGVTAVLFLAAVSGYDQSLHEDRDSNQMLEALMLFDSICNSQWFSRTSIILFLNKADVFKERILVSSIKAHFPDYEGDDTDYNSAREYFKTRFTRLNRSQSKEIYTNYTTAIDTNLIRVVMASVYDIIVTRNLNEIIL